MRGTGGEIRLFPPPVHHSELETWEDWSEVFAKRMMDDVEGSRRVTANELSEALDVQQTGAQNNDLLLFSSRRLACMLAQISDGTALAILRNEDTEWGRLRRHFAVPERARATSLLKQILSFPLRSDQLESDLNDSKNGQKKATGRPLDNILSITLFMQKTKLVQCRSICVKKILMFLMCVTSVKSWRLCLAILIADI